MGKRGCDDGLIATSKHDVKIVQPEGRLCAVVPSVLVSDVECLMYVIYLLEISDIVIWAP